MTEEGFFKGEAAIKAYQMIAIPAETLKNISRSLGGYSLRTPRCVGASAF